MNTNWTIAKWTRIDHDHNNDHLRPRLSAALGWPRSIASFLPLCSLVVSRRELLTPWPTTLVCQSWCITKGQLFGGKKICVFFSNVICSFLNISKKYFGRFSRLLFFLTNLSWDSTLSKMVWEIRLKATNLPATNGQHLKRPDSKKRTSFRSGSSLGMIREFQEIA